MKGYSCRRCLGGYPTVAPGVKPVMALLHREVLLEVGSNSRMKSLGEKKFEFFFVEYLRSADQRDCFDCKHTTED